MQDSEAQQDRSTNRLQSNSLEGFIERLQELRRNDGYGSELTRDLEIQIQAKHALTLAREDGILVIPTFTREELLKEEQFFIGSEHWVDIDLQTSYVAKITIPPAFGLIPGLIQHRGVIERRSIEAVYATPIEYLQRWVASNEIFGDDVRLQSVIQWQDGLVSMAISQPQYHGRPAEIREIEAHFKNAGWQRLKPKFGRCLYFNFAYNVITMDAESRNCYMTKDGLQPFDILLLHPDSELEEYLELY